MYLFKINEIDSNVFWVKQKNNSEEKKVHSFLWLTKLDRKNSKVLAKRIIKSWINFFSNYHPDVWSMETTAKRIIAWLSNTDLTLEDSDKIYKKMEKLYGKEL